MNALIHHEREIIKAFDQSPKHYWKTLIEIAEVSAVSLENVIRIVLTSGEFVESCSRRKDGHPVFTTRKMYSRQTPFWIRLLAAFRGRID